jgi:hypothetical protein
MTVILGENGGLPTTALTSGHLTLTEDGDTLSKEVYGCEVSGNADIAILLDHSTSMLGTVGNRANIYESFYSSVAKFINRLPSGARYCVIPYTDTVRSVFPSYAYTDYYMQGIKLDSINCLDSIRSLTFGGNTSVDSAIPVAIDRLSKSGGRKKIIVLITDDFTQNPDSLGTELFRNGIKLFVLETGKDNAPTNFALAQRSGGTYYQAADTMLYDFYLKKIAEHIKAEHCMVRYTTNKKCPWNSSHTVALTLDYGQVHKTNWHSYLTPHAPIDTIDPKITITSLQPTVFAVTATEDYPCERGLKSFNSVLLTNFTRSQGAYRYPYSAEDTLNVINALFPARADYAATDSSGNVSVKSVFYFPNPDTTQLLPIVSFPMSVDFGRKLAPIDTVITITLVNPNAKDIVITSITPSGNITNITTSLNPTTFTAYEQRDVDVRFRSSLLGNYSASYQLRGDTSSYGEIRAIGSTFGKLHVWIDTTTVKQFGDTGSITLRMSASPQPINLDSVVITLDYDKDLISFITSLFGCTPGSILCNYSLTTRETTDGKIELSFIRGPESLPITLDSTNSFIELPFRTYLAKNGASAISVSDYIASYGSILGYSAGYVRVIDGCGDSTIRAFLNDKNALRISSISLKENKLNVDVLSEEDLDVQLFITDILGKIIISETVRAHKGKNIFVTDRALPSGVYQIRIKSKSSIASLSFAVIR